jgi:membrane fusion protein (multidrug efflux system)
MQAKVESQKGAMRTAELNLEYGTIRAPISGRIGDTLVPVGGLVTPNSPQPLTTIVPLDLIWVRFKVTESEYLAWTKNGRSLPGGELPLTLVLADNSEFPWKGHIENSLNQVDPKTGTLEQVEERRGALLVPQKAVQQLQSLKTVYVVDRDNKVVMLPVKTGSRVGELWVVEEGLKPGDRVVVEGQLRVRPGVVVEPRTVEVKTGD